MLKGSIDVATGRRIAGWVLADDDHSTPVSLLVSADGELVARVLAENYRPDLAAAGLGTGRHGFDIRLDTPLCPRGPHRITLQREDDGADIPGSPLTLAPTGAIEQALQDGIEPGVGDTDLRNTALVLARQATGLLGLLSHRQSCAGERRAYQNWHDRWRRSGPAWDDAAEPPPRPSPRALLLDDRLPAPGRDGGSQALLRHAASLQRLGYAVTLAGAAMQAGLAPDLQQLGLDCCHAPWYGSVEEVLRGQAGSFDLVYLHRLGIARDYLGLVRRHMPRARVIYSVADLHHIRIARQAEAERRPELHGLARQVRAQELASAWGADAVITHSPAEAALLRQEVTAARVHVVPWDLTPKPATQPFAARRGMAFIGHYGHEPNRDAALWLVEEILPLVRQRDPSIECLLVGTDMPAVLRRPREGVRVAGAVADLGAVFNQVRLTVAPLAFGSGIKAKVLDSFAAGVPCVCTPVAAEGLQLPAALVRHVAADTDALAAAILALHGDADLNASSAQAGLALVASQWSPQRVDAAMSAAVGGPPLQAVSPAKPGANPAPATIHGSRTAA